MSPVISPRRGLRPEPRKRTLGAGTDRGASLSGIAGVGTGRWHCPQGQHRGRASGAAATSVLCWVIGGRQRERLDAVVEIEREATDKGDRSLSQVLVGIPEGSRSVGESRFKHADGDVVSTALKETLGCRIDLEEPRSLAADQSEKSADRGVDDQVDSVKPSGRSELGVHHNWCPEPDSNRHGRSRGILSPLCLPISPSGRAVAGRLSSDQAG